MRIAIFHNLPSGGGKRALYEWTRLLSDGHHLDAYTLTTADHLYCDIKPFVEQYYKYDFVPRSLFKSPLGRLNQYQRWRDLREITRIEKRMAGAINRTKYDLVFAHTCMYTFIPPLLQYVVVPSIYYLHEPVGRFFSRSFERPYKIENRLQKVLDQFDPLIRLYNLSLETTQRRSFYSATLVANSRFTGVQMKKAYGLDTVVCHCGVDCESFYPMKDVPKDFSVISVGELTPRKGFDFVIKSLGLIKAESRPKLQLICNRVDAMERGYIEELARNNGVQMDIMVGLNTEELRQKYNSALFCVYAPVLEPFGLVPLEAMACGLPVVGVLEGGVPETIVNEHTGLIVERDPSKFSEAIARLLANPNTIREFGQNGRDYVVSNWTWHRSVNALVDQMEAVVDKVPLG